MDKPERLQNVMAHSMNHPNGEAILDQLEQLLGFKLYRPRALTVLYSTSFDLQ